MWNMSVIESRQALMVLLGELSLSAEGSATSIPHSDSATDDSLNGPVEEGAHDGTWNMCSPQFAEEA